MIQKMSFDVRGISAWRDFEGSWTWNSSYHVGTFTTSAKDERRAFRSWLAARGIRFTAHKTECIDDGEILTICARSDGEPLYAAIPRF